MATVVSSLVEGARQGEESSWNDLVARYENLVWAVVRSFDLSREDSLDVAQLTWLRLIEHLSGLRDPERVGAWLVTTARRESLRVIERRKRSTLLDPADVLVHLADPADYYRSVDLEDELRTVGSALSSLSEKCQALLRVVMVEPPPSYEEVALALDMPIGTIGPRRQRCLAALRAAVSWTIPGG